MITIANAVDTTRFTPRPDLDRAAVRRTAGVGEGPLILNVSRLVPQKGHSYLLDAARIVIDHCPDARFLLAGEGPLQDDLATAVAAHGLQDHVILAGFRPDVADLLAACDVFVLSSLWEGMPVALLEALAAGCPAIATDVGGVRDVVQSGRTGLLVPPADAGALAAAILELMRAPARARALGAAGQAWVRDEFGQATWVRRCEALYTRELGLAS